METGDAIISKTLKREELFSLLFMNRIQWRIQDFQTGGPTPKLVSQPIILAIYPENCMKLKNKMDQEGAHILTALPF